MLCSPMLEEIKNLSIYLPNRQTTMQNLQSSIQINIKMVWTVREMVTASSFRNNVYQKDLILFSGYLFWYFVRAL